MRFNWGSIGDLSIVFNHSLWGVSVVFVRLLKARKQITVIHRIEDNMSIPDYQTCMLPVLKKAEHGEVKISTVVEELSDEFGLTDD